MHRIVPSAFAAAIRALGTSRDPPPPQPPIRPGQGHPPRSAIGATSCAAAIPCPAPLICAGHSSESPLISADEYVLIDFLGAAGGRASKYIECFFGKNSLSFFFLVDGMSLRTSLTAGISLDGARARGRAPLPPRDKPRPPPCWEPSGAPALQRGRSICGPGRLPRGGAIVRGLLRRSNPIISGTPGPISAPRAPDE